MGSEAKPLSIGHVVGCGMIILRIIVHIFHCSVCFVTKTATVPLSIMYPGSARRGGANRHSDADSHSTQSLLLPSGEYSLIDSDPCSVETVPVCDDSRRETFSCFAKGREYASTSTSHKYTSAEKNLLASFDSIEYLPSSSTAYKTWLRRQVPQRYDWQVWLIMALIGFLVGCIGFLLHQLIYVINNFKWEKARIFLTDGNIAYAWLWTTAVSCSLVILSSAAVVGSHLKLKRSISLPAKSEHMSEFIDQQAASSGIPELIGFLSGVFIRRIFTLKTLIVKFISCVLCVSAGMPVGPEGPMIHMGALVGSIISQLGSCAQKFRLQSFSRFKSSLYRRNFISAGVAAGVASAFGAPVGGLLFTMEEVSSYWNMQLSWQIFFCAMISAFTTYLFNSAFHGFVYQGTFGAFNPEQYILFQVLDGVPVNILAFLPAVVLGVIGGFLGALFTFVNLKICRLRRTIIAKLKGLWKQNTFKIAEPVLIMIIFGTVSVLLPSIAPCSQFVCLHGDEKTVSTNCLVDRDNSMRVDSKVENYTCPWGDDVDMGRFIWTNRTYNQLATLLFGTGERRIHHVFSRSTHLQLDCLPLLGVLAFYFTFACWAAGTFISSGILVPMLFIGGLYGRIVGVGLVSSFGLYTKPDTYGLWMDPGAFALVGAASFFGGVSRLTMSLAVIMVELTDDVQFLLPVMTAIMVSKWVGDYFTHPYYHALMELKCIPHLANELNINIDGSVVNPELFEIKDVVAGPAHVVSVRESVSRLAQLLLSNKHGGFPVVRSISQDDSIYFGLITRSELLVILKNDNDFKTAEEFNRRLSYSYDECLMDYTTMTAEANEILENMEVFNEMLTAYATNDIYNNLFVNLEPYANQSTMSVASKLSLHRAYVIFRSLGLRHMVVVDDVNRVVGVVTRKDLMAHNIEERLLLRHRQQRHQQLQQLPRRPSSTASTSSSLL